MAKVLPLCYVLHGQYMKMVGVEHRWLSVQIGNINRETKFNEVDHGKVKLVSFDVAFYGDCYGIRFKVTSCIFSRHIHVFSDCRGQYLMDGH